MVCMCISSCLYLCSRLPCLQLWWLQSQFELPVDRPSFWHLMSNVALVNPHLLLVKQDNHVHVHACAHYITHTHTHTHTSQIVYHAQPPSMSRFINQCLSSHAVCLDKHMRHLPKIDGLDWFSQFPPKNDGHLWLPGSTWPRHSCFFCWRQLRHLRASSEDSSDLGPLLGRTECQQG